MTGSPSTSEAPVVETRYGKVASVTRDGVHVFKGLRYGTSTVGPRPFPAFGGDPDNNVGDNTEELLATYRGIWPNASPFDFAVLIESDLMMRAPSVRFAEPKLAAATGPVYMYLLAWGSGAFDGFVKAGRGIDVPLTMDNVDSAPATRDYPGSRETAVRMSAAWIGFAGRRPAPRRDPGLADLPHEPSRHHGFRRRKPTCRRPSGRAFGLAIGHQLRADRHHLRWEGWQSSRVTSDGGAPDRAAAESGRWDFFVSCADAAADATWGAWLAWQLEDAGYSALLQSWDSVPGSHWTSQLDLGVQRAERTLAVISPAYLRSVYGRSGWEAAYRGDPYGLSRRLIPVRIADCDLPGLLGGIVPVDLFGLSGEQARSRLLDKVQAIVAGRAKPVSAPSYPGVGIPADPHRSAALRAGHSSGLPGSRRAGSPAPSAPGVPALAVPGGFGPAVGVDPEEMTSWWDPAARAVAPGDDRAAAGDGGNDDDGQRWLFTGRGKVNRMLVSWLDDPGDEPVVVLTAAPGSGKSTVTARLIALSVPEFRERYAAEVARQPADQVPRGDFVFATTIWARRRPTGQVAARLRDAFGLPAGSDLHELQDRPAAAGSAPVVVVDAVDEADDPRRLVVEVLRPLATAAQAGVLRLLVATRRFPVGNDPADPLRYRNDLIAPLAATGRHRLVDLDDGWSEPGDVTDYAELVLTRRHDERGRPNPYATQPRARRRLARAIERRAGRSFLLAGHVARAHTLDRTVTDPETAGWRRQFPGSIGQAFEQELTATQGPVDAARTRAVLRPLAYGHGVGLTRELEHGRDLWAVLATAMSATHDDEGFGLTSADVDAVLGEHVASHLVVSVAVDGVPAYRFHHEALAEYFAPAALSESRHAAITSALLDLMATDPADPAGPAGPLNGAAPVGSASTGGARRDWPATSGYLRQAIAWHALNGGRLAELAADPGFAVWCPSDRVHEALSRDDTAASGELRRLLRPLLQQVRGQSPTERAALLSLAALAVPRLRPLVTGFASYGPGWFEGVSATGDTQPEHLTVTLGQGLITAMASQVAEGQPQLAVALRFRLCLLDPDSGSVLFTAVADRESGPYSAVAFGRDGDGFSYLAAGDRAVHVWDPATGARRHVLAVPAPVRLLVTGRLPDRRGFLAGAGNDEVRVWDPTDGTVLHRIAGAASHLAAVPVAGRDYLAIAGQQVRLVDPVDGVTVASLPLAVRGPGRKAVLAAAASRGPSPASMFAVLTEQGIMVWRPGDGSWHGALEQGVPGGPATSVAVGFRPDGTPFAVAGFGDGTVRLWDGDESRPRFAVAAHRGAVERTAVTAARDGTPVVLTQTGGQLGLWDADTGEQLGELRPASGFLALADGRRRDGSHYVAAGSAGSSIQIWDVDQPARVAHTVQLGPVVETVVGRLPGGELVVVAATETGDLLAWDLATADLRWSLVGEGREARLDLAVATYQDGTEHLVVSGRRADTGDAVGVTLYDLPTGRRTAVLGTVADDGIASTAVSRTPAGTALVACAGRADVTVWDAETGKRQATVTHLVHDAGVLDNQLFRVLVDRRGDGSPLLATGGGDGSLLLWELTGGAAAKSLPRHRGHLTAIVTGTGRDGSVFGASASRDGDLLVWDPDSGEVLHNLSSDDGWVFGIATGNRRDGTPFLVADNASGSGSTIRLWDPTTGELLFSSAEDTGTETHVLGAGHDRDGEPFVLLTMPGAMDLLLPGPPVRRLRITLPSDTRRVVVRHDVVVLTKADGFTAFRILRASAPRSEFASGR